MKITKRQLIAALDAAYNAGVTYAVQKQYNLDTTTPESVVKRIAKHQAKHAKIVKLRNVILREHWNVAKDYAINMELGVGKSATLPDLIAEFDLEFDLTSTTSDNNESNAIKLNETSTEEDV